MLLPHFQHSIGQIRQLLADYTGRRRVPDDLRYAMSEGAISDCLKNPEHVRALANEPAAFRPKIRDAGAFIIEISTIVEHKLVVDEGLFHCSFFLQQSLTKFGDQLRPLTTSGEMRWLLPSQVVRRQPGEKDFFSAVEDVRKSFGDRPVLLIPHLTPAKADAKVIKARRRVAALVREAAQRFGCDFLDPSFVIDLIGQEKALKDGGADYAHFTEEAEILLSGAFADWADRATDQAARLASVA